VLNDCRCTPLLLPCGVCALLQVCKQQEALHEHSSKLADAKQQLQAQLADLLQHQEQLSQHKQELQQQVQQLQEQQQQHVGDKLQLQEQIEQLQASQQQLQETSALLAADVTAAKDHLQQNAAQSASAAAGKAGKQQQQQRDNAALSGASGDLQLQLSVPGNVTHTPIIIIIIKIMITRVSSRFTCESNKSILVLARTPPDQSSCSNPLAPGPVTAATQQTKNSSKLLLLLQPDKALLTHSKPFKTAATNVHWRTLPMLCAGFTDALVSRIGEAELVPKFAEALVNQVSYSSAILYSSCCATYHCSLLCFVAIRMSRCLTRHQSCQSTAPRRWRGGGGGGGGTLLGGGGGAACDGFV
jgi:hypothetical protein